MIVLFVISMCLFLWNNEIWSGVCLGVVIYIYLLRNGIELFFGSVCICEEILMECCGNSGDSLVISLLLLLG